MLLFSLRSPMWWIFFGEASTWWLWHANIHSNYSSREGKYWTDEIKLIFYFVSVNICGRNMLAGVYKFTCVQNQHRYWIYFTLDCSECSRWWSIWNSSENAYLLWNTCGIFPFEAKFFERISRSRNTMGLGMNMGLGIYDFSLFLYSFFSLSLSIFLTATLSHWRYEIITRKSNHAHQFETECQPLPFAKYNQKAEACRCVATSVSNCLSLFISFLFYWTAPC